MVASDSLTAIRSNDARAAARALHAVGAELELVKLLRRGSQLLELGLLVLLELPCRWLLWPPDPLGPTPSPARSGSASPPAPPRGALPPAPPSGAAAARSAERASSAADLDGLDAEAREDKVLQEFGMKRLSQDFSDLPTLKLKCDGALHSLKGRRDAMED